MQSHIWKHSKIRSTLSLYVKCGALFLLISLSILVAACGTSPGTSATSLGASMSTVTIQIGNSKASPTPPLPGYWCGAWVTNTTPAYDAAGSIPIYAKFTQNVNGNPVGIADATVTANVMWNTSDVEPYTATTGADGLAVIAIKMASKDYAIGTITLITLDITKDGTPGCQVKQDRAAFFALTRVSPTPTPSKTPTGRHNNNPTPTSTTPANGGGQPGGPGNGLTPGTPPFITVTP